MEALAFPLTILSNSKPVTPLAGILYKPAPSPINEALTVPPLLTMILLPLSKTSELLSVKYKNELLTPVP